MVGGGVGAVEEGAKGLNTAVKSVATALRRWPWKPLL